MEKNKKDLEIVNNIQTNLNLHNIKNIRHDEHIKGGRWRTILIFAPKSIDKKEYLDSVVRNIGYPCYEDRHTTYSKTGGYTISKQGSSKISLICRYESTKSTDSLTLTKLFTHLPNNGKDYTFHNSHQLQADIRTGLICNRDIIGNECLSVLLQYIDTHADTFTFSSLSKSNKEKFNQYISTLGKLLALSDLFDNPINVFEPIRTISIPRGRDITCAHIRTDLGVNFTLNLVTDSNGSFSLMNLISKPNKFNNPTLEHLRNLCDKHKNKKTYVRDVVYDWGLNYIGYKTALDSTKLIKSLEDWNNKDSSIETNTNVLKLYKKSLLKSNLSDKTKILLFKNSSTSLTNYFCLELKLQLESDKNVMRELADSKDSTLLIYEDCWINGKVAYDHMPYYDGNISLETKSCSNSLRQHSGYLSYKVDIGDFT